MNFEFASPNQIHFGSGKIGKVPELANQFGNRVFLLIDSKERCLPLIYKLREKKFIVDYLLVNEEPRISVVLMAIRNIKELKSQLIIGFGGGAALDTGKAAAALSTNPGNPSDYLEILGSGKSLELPSLPYIAIPTTAGTGSEVTRNAVITVPEKRIKVSLRSFHMIPKIAIVDPELTYSMPRPITASTGMDALTQLIEPFVCNSPSPLTDALCRDGIARTARSLGKAYENGLDTTARSDMALASLFGGMALANARLGAVHGMANLIGGTSHAPHGAICARLLPSVMEKNIHALRSRLPDSPALARYTEVAWLLTGNLRAKAEDGTTWVRDLCKELDIRPLSEYGLESKDFPALVEQSQKANSMKGNPIHLTDSELHSILQEAV
jgi:alcohol dehydrogenase class IV